MLHIIVKHWRIYDEVHTGWSLFVSFHGTENSKLLMSEACMKGLPVYLKNFS